MEKPKFKYRVGQSVVVFHGNVDTPAIVTQRVHREINSKYECMYKLVSWRGFILAFETYVKPMKR